MSEKEAILQFNDNAHNLIKNKILLGKLILDFKHLVENIPNNLYQKKFLL